ncbi:serine hydrolase [Methanoculleus sp. FWC-SCC1]|uniref:Serine hydrolase n=1 Tax=Methanoculleus frigidifontis TaxID=2584085 RepID=A0ABT8M7B0_9EURY|nr:serine hydrolase domain-containing protein [Methanoculleus sp. FWC-SCC1]MDN7023815.1 serine hydrolase [Methanoculleus sp. FWC-SCC1]
MRIAGLLLAIGILACGCLGASAPHAEGGDTVSQDLDDYMTALADAGRFSGAVLVARDDTVLLSKGYGMANYEFSVPNTPQTVFPIGSNTKQFTAAGIMKLQEQGRLNVTDPVVWYVPDAPLWKDIRIYHLLNHTSGIPSEGGFLLTDPVDYPLSGLVSRISALPLTFAPGTDYTYSNNGYITLSYIIEQASGMPYDAYLQESIFAPCGMTGTGQDNARDVFANRASGYTTMAGRHVHYDLQNIHNSYGAGSLHSTTEDLSAWERAFHTPGAVLSAASVDAMTRHGYGIVDGAIGNRTAFGHGGRNFGFISYTLSYPDENVTVLFLANHDRTPMVSIARDLSAIVFGEPYALPRTIERRAVPLNETARAEYIGVYEPVWEKTWTFTVFPDGDWLWYTSAVPCETVELFYEGNDTFFVTPESADSFIFTRDTNGTVDGMVMYTMEGTCDAMVKVS